MSDFSTPRALMVEEQLRSRGIADERVLAAMGRVPREEFVAADDRARAYADGPLPIGHRQTISQPYMVARMVELARVEPGHSVLEVGAGSGYQAAVLAELGAAVWTIERVAELGERARERLARLGYSGVTVGVFDGSGGWLEHAPYRAVIVAAGAPLIPPSLVEQLADGGRLIIPVGQRGGQQLAVVTRRGADHEVEWDTACTFVDLLGKHGWGDEAT